MVRICHIDDGVSARPGSWSTDARPVGVEPQRPRQGLGRRRPKDGAVDHENRVPIARAERRDDRLRISIESGQTSAGDRGPGRGKRAPEYVRDCAHDVGSCPIDRDDVTPPAVVMQDLGREFGIEDVTHGPQPTLGR